MIVFLTVVQPNPQQSVTFVELEEDFRRADPIRDVEMAPDLKNIVRCKITRRRDKTYVNFPGAQQFISADGLVVVYPDMDLGLAGVDHEGALFIPKSKKRSEEKRAKTCQERVTSYTRNSSIWDGGMSCAPCLQTSGSRRV